MIKINLLYYKNILDMVIADFFNDHGNLFVRENGKYVMGDDYTHNRLKGIFKEYISDKLQAITTQYDMFNPEYYFIIGACLPRDNVLLNYRNDKYFPEKLDKLIKCKFPVKYYLKERDIEINIVRFNEVLIEIFNDMFTSRKNIEKLMGEERAKNIFFIQHRNLDCYSMYKIIKHIYGRTTCVNMFKKKLSDMKLHIVAVNELICKYINNKKELLKSSEFNNISEEVKQYVDSCINSLV